MHTRTERSQFLDLPICYMPSKFNRLRATIAMIDAKIYEWKQKYLADPNTKERVFTQSQIEDAIHYVPRCK